MIITIQSINKRFVVKSVYKLYSCDSITDATKFAGIMADVIHQSTGERPIIKILSIPFNPMAMTKKTYPAKKKAAVAKKKVVVKGKKK